MALTKRVYLHPVSLQIKCRPKTTPPFCGAVPPILLFLLGLNKQNEALRSM